MNSRDANAVNVFVTPPPSSNGLGVAGFVLSLIGFLTCGLLSPLGLLLSAVGLRKLPRGLAVAGLVLGLVGSLWMVLGGLMFGLTILGFATAATAVVDVAAKEAKINMVRVAVLDKGPIAGAIDLYKLNMGKYPQELKNLVEKPSNNRELEKWGTEPYLQDARGLKDPWGNDYMYESPGKHNQSSYDLWSKGPDGIDGNDDDIVSWESDRGLPPPGAGAAGRGGP